MTRNTTTSRKERITVNASRTGKAHAMDNEQMDEWLQSRPGEHFSIRIPASATNGSYSVTEILSSPGDSTPVHLHENEDEHILVVEGTARASTERSTVCHSFRAASQNECRNILKEELYIK